MNCADLDHEARKALRQLIIQQANNLEIPQTLGFDEDKTVKVIEGLIDKGIVTIEEVELPEGEVGFMLELSPVVMVGHA